jgi:hypothetical protein
MAAGLHEVLKKYWLNGQWRSIITGISACPAGSERNTDEAGSSKS